MLPRLSVHIGRKLLNTTGGFQKGAECRFSRLVHNSINVPCGKGLTFNVQKHSKVYGVYLVRYESTVNTRVTETVSNTQPDLFVEQTQKVVDVNNTELGTGLISEIPEPPVPTITEEIVEAITLHANGEATFSSIGLGGYGPFGLIQYYFEWLHISLDMPWWAAIVCTSIAVKILTIPFAIDSQRNNIKMQHVLPEMVTIQENMTQARSSGNREQASLHAYELQEFFKKNKIKLFPTSNFIRLGAHVPIFIALRQMANTPVESLKHGGISWFTDLTIADPYYLLPLFTTGTLFLVTENAMRGPNTSNLTPTMRYVMRGLPIISFLFSMHFPGAVLLHWVTTNITTVMQNHVFQNAKVQAYFNIPRPIVHPPRFNPKTSKKSLKEAFTDSWTNMKISNKLANHARADVTQFNAAAKGPLKRTYKYNPVQRVQKAPSMSAMKK